MPSTVTETFCPARSGPTPSGVPVGEGQKRTRTELAAVTS